MKQQRFKLEEGYKPTKEGIERNREIHNKCLYYGIPIGIFTSSNKTNNSINK